MNNMIWGIILIVVGVLWGVDVLGIIDINLFFKGWWSLFIIIPSIISLVCKKKESKVWSIFWLLIGIFLLMCSWDIFSYSLLFKLFIPFILVFVGIYLIVIYNKQK